MDLSSYPESLLLSPETSVGQMTDKERGGYYTPEAVVQTLVSWAVRHETDVMLDPSCGDGRFLAGHTRSVGVERDPIAAVRAAAAVPSATVYTAEFFGWAAACEERFDCLAGNPPFIRYQTFKGEVRSRALALCAELGAEFSGLASSWAPFLVAASSLLKPGGRMAFVVPAEIGHAPYARPVLEHLARRFATVQVVAYREKLFPDLSEDCWLLYADGYGGSTDELRFTALERLSRIKAPPRAFVRVALDEWRAVWGGRLRPYLLPQSLRTTYRNVSAGGRSSRLGELATVGIGYVTGANNFFHLRPSDAKRWGIPRSLLMPAVRRGASLPRDKVTKATVEAWRRADEAYLLLRLKPGAKAPEAVARYLDSEAGQAARQAYKCRVREPWYAVPDVQVPDFFLTYMSGIEPALVANEAGCTCTNSVHAVRLKPGVTAQELQRAWPSDFVRLSAELQGHALGGGMLKLEPREASQVVLPAADAVADFRDDEVAEGLRTMRRWRGVIDAA